LAEYYHVAMMVMDLSILKLFLNGNTHFINGTDFVHIITVKTSHSLKCCLKTTMATYHN